MPTVTQSPSASLTTNGVVTTGTQSFAGNKKFQDRISVGLETHDVVAICYVAGPSDFTTPAIRLGQSNAPTARYFDWYFASNGGNIALQLTGYNGTTNYGLFVRDNGTTGTGRWDSIDSSLFSDFKQFNVITPSIVSNYVGLSMFDTATQRLSLLCTNSGIPYYFGTFAHCPQVLALNSDLGLSSRGSAEASIAFFTSPFGSGHMHQAKIDPRGNLCLVKEGVSPGNSMQRGILIGSGSAPTSNITDSFQMWGQDQTGGNCAPHFKTEDGDIIRLYQSTVVNPPTGGGTVDAEARLAVSGVIQALKDMGFIALS